MVLQTRAAGKQSRDVFVSGITLLLACMGLYGLVAYNLTRRLKEFSVRKVFGANIVQIFRLMNADYIWIVAVALIIGIPWDRI